MTRPRFWRTLNELLGSTARRLDLLARPRGDLDSMALFTPAARLSTSGSTGGARNNGRGWRSRFDPRLTRRCDFGDQRVRRPRDDPVASRAACDALPQHP